jgi:hypothetical protein
MSNPLVVSIEEWVKTAFRAPWRVVPDQEAHGTMLDVVDSASLILLRTPEVESYNCRQQRELDVPVAELAAKAPEMLALLMSMCKLELYGADHPHRIEVYQRANELAESIRRHPPRIRR